MNPSEHHMPENDGAAAQLPPHQSSAAAPRAGSEPLSPCSEPQPEANPSESINTLILNIRRRILSSTAEWNGILERCAGSRPSSADANAAKALQKEVQVLQEQLALAITTNQLMSQQEPAPHAAHTHHAIDNALNNSLFDETRRFTMGPIVPHDRPSPLPSNLPTFNRPSASSTSSVHDFLTAFEDRLDAHGYPRHRFTLALIACCDKNEADWCRSELSSLPWSIARQRFLEHYVSNDMVAVYRDRFESIRKSPKETVLGFADRYLQAMRLAELDPKLGDRVTHLIHRLPDYVRKDLHLVKFTRPEALASVQSLVDTLTAICPGDRMQQPTGELQSSSPSSNDRTKWCTYHRSAGHDDASCQAQMKSGPASSQSRRPRKWCQFHNSSAHDSSECRASRSTGNTASSPATALPKTSSNPAPPAARSPPMRCFNCQSATHFSKQCPLPPQTQSRHLMDIPEPAIDTTADPSSYDATVDDVLDLFDTQTRTIHASSTDHHATGFFVPVVLGGILHEPAYIDSGASHSSVPEDVLELLPPVLRRTFIAPPPNSTVSLGALGVSVPRLGSIELPFTWDSKPFVHRFEVVQPPKGIRVIIGRNLFGPLGIIIGGLPVPTARQANDSSDDVVPTLASNADAANPFRQHPNLLAAIKRNQAIPVNSFCKLPEAVVHLNTNDESPVYRRQYRLAHSLQPIVDAQISQWLADGKVMPASRSCQWNHPLLVVPKKTSDGTKVPGRVCIDPRALNAKLTPERFPMPRVRDIFETMAGRKVFSSLDLEQSFLQLPIHIPDREKVAFSWNGRQFMFVGTPFGLTPTSAVLQRTIATVLQHSNCAVPFQDDITIGSHSDEDHLDDLSATIDLLTAANLRLRVAKCSFFCRTLSLLGHVLSAQGIAIDRRKLADVEGWPTPTSGKQVQQYLGLLNYFRDFIPDYSTLAAPLEELRSIPTLEPSHWSPRHDRAFSATKAILAQAPFLSFPDFSKEFQVAVDASGSGIAGVLYQLSDPSQPDIVSNRQWITFVARALQPAERKYSATKRELLSIVFTLRKLHFYIWGNPFHLFTDHRSLTFLLTQKELNPMLSGWLETILAYTFKVTHRPGVLNVLPDRLSRLYPPADPVASPTPDPSLLLSDIPTPLPESERRPAIERAHLLGHFGVKATVAQLLHSGVFWPGLRRDVADYLKQCTACQRFTITQQGYHPLTPITADAPMDHIAIDTALSFKTSPRGMNVLLALFAVFVDFGFPRVIQSDNGTEFVNRLVAQMVQACGIDHRLVTAYHPRANGLAERNVQTVCRAIRKQLASEEGEWDRYVPAVQLFCNLRVASAHASAPFAVMFCRAANPFDAQPPAVDAIPPTYGDVRARLHWAQEVVFPAVKDAHSSHAAAAIAQYAKRHRILAGDPFPVNSYVMLQDPKRSSKADPFYLGPFKVIRRTKGGSYILLGSNGDALPRAAAPSQLKMVQLNPPLDPDTYLVDKILSHKGPPAARKYLVRWRGYDSSHDSWEPQDNFVDTACVVDYWRNIKSGRN